MGRKKRKKKKKAGPFDKFLGLILILAAFGLAGFLVYKTITDMDRQQTWTKTTATAEFSRSFTTSTSRGSFKTNVVSIQYEVNGKMMRSQVHGKSSGGTIEIYYDPEHPAKATNAKSLESKSHLWFLIACPVLFLAGLGVMTDGRNPDYEALKAETDAAAAAAKARKRKRKGKKRRK